MYSMRKGCIKLVGMATQDKNEACVDKPWI